MKAANAQAKVKILVVDDSSVTRDMVRAILSSMGVDKVVQADDGKAALAQIFEGGIDLVICDWNMPHMPGIEVLKQVRADERFGTLPFIMLTAEAYRENITEAIKLGVSDYVSKPFTAEVLSAKVVKLLQGKLKA